MSAKHGAALRGLHRRVLDARSPDPQLFLPRFSRLFPKLSPASYGDSDPKQFAALSSLAKAMVASFDPPKDGIDLEESGIPALYTYFGQFIDHDLTFDPNGSFQKQKDPDATEDFRTPAFDLDNVYGRGPDDQPYLYEADGRHLLLGDPLTLGADGARDLPRSASGRALIGDPRNDENTLVSQLQGLFLRFHNRIADENPTLPFSELQRLVRYHYQYVVLNDFLPRIVHPAVLELYRTDGRFDDAKLQYFKPEAVSMPVEFSGAAYRLGHSMVRPGYRLNDAVLLPIFPFPIGSNLPYPEALTGFRRMISNWGLDWGRFIDLCPRSDDGSKLSDHRRLQFAYKIDTSLSDPLGNLPATVVGNRPPSLALRNLLRGLEYGLPSGQAVAKAMGLQPLCDSDILIGKDSLQNDGSPEPTKCITDLGAVFAGNCPLWVYILAETRYSASDVAIPIVGEARLVRTPQLGPVGGRLVTEVFLGLLAADAGSYLNADPEWEPAVGAGYRLRDFVAYALGH